jgi:hypothetical protein
MLNEVKRLNRFFADAQNDNFELAIGINSKKLPTLKKARPFITFMVRCICHLSEAKDLLNSKV